ncbi:lipoprotein-releasing ABC transporter permease subunit LolC [Candidatus Erwinia haradaeae]|uniref:Lipoprotein-releasing system transmembrane protein LolC n=1 Tax=Candidatus Erwinia haradaeae TaxID=1922217 RepID=A0A451D369_9GAMM|nr:lipoprotein-releasing ABC transporter permease subunit LolC [Candidatus Erwinia haradaeae]VFP80110.1 Lipoprotein-releasing system transmembrane protein LolC [Candidatus Erwinia haradaeae]
MYQPLVLCISMRYINGFGSGLNGFGYLIFWFSIIGLTIGVMVLVTVLSVMNGLEQRLEMQTLGLIPQAFIIGKNGPVDPNTLPRNIFRLKGVTRIQSFTTGEVILHSTHSMAIGLLLGVNTDLKDSCFSNFIKTQYKQLKAGKYNVIIGSKLADDLSVQLNSKVRLLVPANSLWTPIGRVPSQRLFNVIGTFPTQSDLNGYEILVNQQDAANLMHYPNGYITGWRLWLQQPLNITSIHIPNLPKCLVWHDWRESKGALFQAVKIEKNIMSLLISLIVIIAIFNIVTALCLLIVEKKGEIAILQTQGFRPRQIMFLCIIQSMIIGLGGVTLGVFLGILLSSQIGDLMFMMGFCDDKSAFPVVISMSQIVIIGVIFNIISFLSVLYPSYCATVIQPVETLRYE